jgi:hypothetical protein
VGDKLIFKNRSSLTVEVVTVNYEFPAYTLRALTNPNGNALAGYEWNVTIVECERAYNLLNPAIINIDLSSNAISQLRQLKPCTCDSLELMRKGCLCGSIEKKQWGLRG